MIFFFLFCQLWFELRTQTDGKHAQTHAIKSPKTRTKQTEPKNVILNKYDPKQVVKQTNPILKKLGHCKIWVKTECNDLEILKINKLSIFYSLQNTENTLNVEDEGTDHLTKPAFCCQCPNLSEICCCYVIQKELFFMKWSNVSLLTFHILLTILWIKYRFMRFANHPLFLLTVWAELAFLWSWGRREPK